LAQRASSWRYLAGENAGAVGTRAVGNRLRHRTHSTLDVRPDTALSIDLTHHVMNQHVTALRQMTILIYNHLRYAVIIGLGVTRNRTRSSATTEIARDADETAIQGHQRSFKVTVVVPINLHLRPFLRYHAQFAHPYPTSLSGGTGKRRLGVDGHALVSWCQEHWTIQPQT